MDKDEVGLCRSEVDGWNYPIRLIDSIPHSLYYMRDSVLFIDSTSCQAERITTTDGMLIDAWHGDGMVQHPVKLIDAKQASQGIGNKDIKMGI